MALTQGITLQAKQDWLSGVHDAADTYKIALYTSAATYGPSTTTYSSTNEVANGNGYTTGGAVLTGFSVTLDGTTAILDFTNNPSWEASTITARGFMIYNSSKSDKVIFVGDFGGDVSSTNDTFSIVFPAPAADTGLIRIA